jgi:hypothetical protein
MAAGNFEFQRHAGKTKGKTRKKERKKERKAQKSIGNRQLALGRRRRHEGTNPGSWKRPRIFWLWAAQRFFWSSFVM